MSNLLDNARSVVAKKSKDLSLLFNANGEIIGMPQCMFEKSPEYSLEVRKELEQYGNLVNDVSPEIVEYFKKLIEYWRPSQYRRRCVNENDANFYEQAEDQGLVGDGEISKFVAGYILNFMSEHEVNNSFMQKMFNEIWRDTGLFNIITNESEKKASDWIDMLFGGPQAVINRRNARRQDMIMSNDIAQGLLAVAKKLFGNNGTFDLTDVNALYIFETALRRVQSDSGIHDEKEMFNLDEIMAKLILTFCKDVVIYWSRPENIKRIPIEKRRVLIAACQYVKNPQNDFTLEQLGFKQLPVFDKSSLEVYANAYTYIQANLSNVSADILDGDYMSYDYRGDRDYKSRPKIPAPYRYYSMQTRLELAELMTDGAACQYYIKLIELQESQSRKLNIDNGSIDYEIVNIFRLIASRTPDPKIKLKYLKKWLQYDNQAKQIYADIDDEYLLFADDIRRNIIPASKIPTLDKKHQDIAMLIYERTNNLTALIEVQGENPYETAHTDLSKRALKAIVEYYAKFPRYDFSKLLIAIDIILASSNYAVSAHQMREVLLACYAPIKKKYNKKAKSSYYANHPEAIEESYYGEQKNELEQYIARLTAQMIIEGQMTKRVSEANPEIIKPEILRLTRTIK
ncbi:MAG: hypothetical protein K2J20_05995, partial [Bacilli bacterium]|nr:hypothetical protein [Bacilli bacterium]